MKRKNLLKEWKVIRDSILGQFNAGQSHGLLQAGSVTMTADQQNKEAEYNCRDAQIAVDKVADFFISKIGN